MISKCEFCLLITKNLNKCVMCDNPPLFCERCFRLHIDFHPIDDDILNSVKEHRICGLDNCVGDKTGMC